MERERIEMRRNNVEATAELLKERRQWTKYDLQ